MPTSPSRQIDDNTTDTGDEPSIEGGGQTPSPVQKIDGTGSTKMSHFPPMTEDMSSDNIGASCNIPNQVTSRPENYEAALKAMRDANPILEEYPQTLQAMLSMLVNGNTPEEIGVAAQQLLAEEMKAKGNNRTKTSGSLVADPKFAEHFVHEKIRSYQIQTLSDDGSKSTRTVEVILICRNPEIIVIPNALTSEECDLIKSLAKEQGFFNSHVRDLHVKANGKDIENLVAPMDYKTSQTVLRREIRSSKTALIPASGGDNGIIEVVQRRISSMVKLPYENLERINVIRYDENDQFVTHIDGHFRAATAYAFLDEPPYGGGEVDFSQLGFQINPKKGLIFAYTNNQAAISESVMAPQEALPALLTLHAFNPINSKPTEAEVKSGDEAKIVASKEKNDNCVVDDIEKKPDVLEEEEDSGSEESSDESDSDTNCVSGAYFFFSLTEQSK